MTYYDAQFNNISYTFAGKKILVSCVNLVLIIVYDFS